MIRQNKKMAFGEPSDDEQPEEKKKSPEKPEVKKIEPTKDDKPRSRDAMLLAGIGSGILRDLEASIHEDQVRMNESMTLVSGRKNRDEDEAETERERKVRFASNISHNISASKDRPDDSVDEENKSSEEEQQNKLAGLNKMLRDGGLDQLM